MWGKTHTPAARVAIGAAKSFQVLVYDKDMVLIHDFISNTAAGLHFNVFPGTIGRYKRSGKLFLGMYYLKGKVKS
jgi:hypothetical protein